MNKARPDQATSTPMQRIVEALMQPAFLVLFLLALIFAMLMDRRTPSGVSLLLCVDAAPLLATLACLSNDTTDSGP